MTADERMEFVLVKERPAEVTDERRHGGKHAVTIPRTVSYAEGAPDERRNDRGCLIVPTASTPALSFINAGGTLTWKKSGTTTVSLADTAVGQGACPKHGSVEHHLTGVVTGGTSPYVRDFDPVSLRLCVTEGGIISLVAGTSASL